ncbi:MAG: tetratricopeptide repeat protein [Syntrophobacteraceae bacterium]|nr:tetratricopeptide repeat protein [Syntrophobacteraceae bacterium]
MTNRVVKFNPSFLSDEALKENFVVRLADLDLIVGVVRENTTGANQHVLVIGPRGSGKTTLVLRAALEVRKDSELSRLWYPLVFSEESYQVVSAGEFWLEALFHLSEQTGEERWKRTWSELRDETDDNRMGERALYQLLDFADSQGKRILLIVENLNMLLGDLVSDGEAWKIRHTLMNEPRLMLLASATNRFEHFENSSQAMFEMFKMHQLVPLGDDECNAVWELAAGQKLEGEKIRPIRILTGGNPRLLAIIAKFGAGRSFGRLLDDLVDLIDDHTEYFKSHLDSLPATERKAYLALAELWDLSTAREVAKAARLEVSTASSLLNRLSGRGAVSVETKGKRTKYYAVAERMYNIYYLMRRRGKPSERVKAAVKFMVGMYGPESATKFIAEEACKLGPELCRDHYLAFAEIVKGVRDPQLLDKILSSTPKNFLESPYIDGSIKNFALPGRRSETYENYRDAVNISRKKASDIIKRGFKLFMDGDYEQALITLDNLMRKFGDSTEPALAELVARALVNKGVTLGALGRSEDEIRVYEEVVDRYSGSTAPALAEQVATALFNKGVTLGALGRSEDEIKVCEEVVERFGDRTEPALAEQVARALVNKGATLGALGRSEDAIKVCEEVVDRFGGSTEPALQELVALALVYKGIILGELGRYEQAEESLRKAAQLDPESTAAHAKLIEVLLQRPERQDDAVRLAEEITCRKPDEAALLNGVSWSFYKRNIPSLLQKGEAWARRAVSIAPDNSSCNHTLACIRAALGNGREALEAAQKYIVDVELVQNSIEDAITLFVDLASSGYAKESLDLIENLPVAAHLEPLIVGLKLYCGEDVKTAVAILEVARDVVQRIEERKKEIKSQPRI